MKRVAEASPEVQCERKVQGLPLPTNNAVQGPFCASQTSFSLPGGSGAPGWALHMTQGATGDRLRCKHAPPSAALGPLDGFQRLGVQGAAGLLMVMPRIAPRTHGV